MLPATVGPFDGNTLEDAEQEVVDTLFPDLRERGTPHSILAAKGLELVPLEPAHAVQYAREKAS